MLLNGAIESRNIDIVKLLLKYKVNSSEAQSLKLVGSKHWDMIALLKNYCAE